MDEQESRGAEALQANGRTVMIVQVGDRFLGVLGVMDTPRESARDVALETADVALMGDDLRALPFAVGLSRAARRIIQQNLWASLGMVAFLIPATVFGFAGIGLAVALHEGSTLLVVANALRLLAFASSSASS